VFHKYITKFSPNHGIAPLSLFIFSVGVLDYKFQGKIIFPCMYLFNYFVHVKLLFSCHEKSLFKGSCFHSECCSEDCRLWWIMCSGLLGF
jgi:hypothetical protein